ncbi:hypothetical protein DSAG12_02553 [Promethearchaeum syntrophicum]|uniref:Fibronectin type-III domain-containing protein n=1 Tax=Promethearchaeum syntrophicum TaxID=2594042 RepID=A0A5B9DD93_9ARCH|nr:hypothetical protein [Candidatus Prometheoarchaeum syntrophicum]QEE16723.1 hypothetical protein DSAG12_02553 [Candidatus Prometheoarchaeum syntrophicum]
MGQNQGVIDVKVGVVPETPIFTTLTQTINSSEFTIEWTASNYTDVYNIYLDDTIAGNTTITEFLLEFDNNGDYIVGLSVQNEYGISNRALPITIIDENPNFKESNDNHYRYFFGGGWIIVAGFIGVAFVKMKLKK